MCPLSEAKRAAQCAHAWTLPEGTLPWAILRALRSTALLAAMLLLTPGVSRLSAQSPHDQQLDQLLARLGLVDLQILHLERTLQEDAVGANGNPLARRLADLYAGRLMDRSDDKPVYEDTIQRIQNLIRDYPEANTTALQVMLLQADYNRAESRIGAWTADATDQAAQTKRRRSCPESHRCSTSTNRHWASSWSSSPAEWTGWRRVTN